MEHRYLLSFRRADAVLIAALAIVACSDDARTRDRTQAGAPTVSVKLLRDGQAAEAIAAPADLWQLCGGGTDLVVVAHGPNGFVRGECSAREQMALRLEVGARGARAVLRRRATKAIVASAEPIATVSVAQTSAPKTPVLAELRIEVSGGQTFAVTPDDLSGLTGKRRARRGVPLTAVLEHIGLAPSDVESLVVRGRDDYSIDPAWLRAGDHQLLLRHNRRGRLRFYHASGGVERRRVAPVEVIAVRLRDP